MENMIDIHLLVAPVTVYRGVPTDNDTTMHNLSLVFCHITSRYAYTGGYLLQGKWRKSQILTEETALHKLVLFILVTRRKSVPL